MQRDKLFMKSYSFRSFLALGSFVLGFLTGCHKAQAEASSKHATVEIGTVNLGSEPIQTPRGPMKLVGRMVDAIPSETPKGCRIALAVTNSPRSPNLHVIIDGKRVPGYDDVAWRSLRLSADGKHYAFVNNQNGKQVCVRDGVAGAEFDKIGREESAGLVFSPDGQHLAYAATKSSDQSSTASMA
jgi:hypothetical protein